MRKEFEEAYLKLRLLVEKSSAWPDADMDKVMRSAATLEEAKRIYESKTMKCEKCWMEYEDNGLVLCDTCFFEEKKAGEISTGQPGTAY